MAIRFFSKYDSFHPTQKRKHYHWLKQVFRQENKLFDQINVIFCTDDYLYRMNLDYLNHETLTDVITFQYNNHPISGDIFISIDRIKENAEIYKTLFEEELKRVIVHGVLHLCGHQDNTRIEKKAIRKLENYYLGFYK